jgi:hypothetical protein
MKAVDWVDRKFPWQHVMSLLRVADLVRLGMTCRALRVVAKSPTLWKAHAMRICGDERDLDSTWNAMCHDWKSVFVCFSRTLNVSGCFDIRGCQANLDAEEDYRYLISFEERGEWGHVVGAGHFDARRPSPFLLVGVRRGLSLWFLQYDDALSFIISVAGKLDSCGACHGVWTGSAGWSGVWQGHRGVAPDVRDAAFVSLLAEGDELGSKPEAITDLRGTRWRLEFSNKGDRYLQLLAGLDLAFGSDNDLMRNEHGDLEFDSSYKDVFGLHAEFEGGEVRSWSCFARVAELTGVRNAVRGSHFNWFRRRRAAAAAVRRVTGPRGSSSDARRRHLELSHGGQSNVIRQFLQKTSKVGSAMCCIKGDSSSFARAWR